MKYGDPASLRLIDVSPRRWLSRPVCSANAGITSLTHAVTTRDSAGNVKMYLNGGEVTVDNPTIGGELDDYEPKPAGAFGLPTAVPARDLSASGRAL